MKHAASRPKHRKRPLGRLGSKGKTLPGRVNDLFTRNGRNLEIILISICVITSISIVALISVSGDSFKRINAVAGGSFGTRGLANGASQDDGQLAGPDTSQLDSDLEGTGGPANRGVTGTWRVEGDERYFYLQDGTKATGTIIINDAEVCFDEQGRWQWTRIMVPYISQLPDMPYGCEVVSVTMMLNYAGVEVTKEEIAEAMPYADDPDLGFTGSLYDDWDYWDYWDYWYYSEGGIIWPPALLDLVTSYVGSAVDLTECSQSVIFEQIDKGRPVCVWFGSDGYDHTVLLTGYSKTEVWVNDPLNGEDLVISLDDFLFMWEQNGYRALSY